MGAYRAKSWCLNSKSLRPNPPGLSSPDSGRKFHAEMSFFQLPLIGNKPWDLSSRFCLVGNWWIVQAGSRANGLSLNVGFPAWGIPNSVHGVGLRVLGNSGDGARGWKSRGVGFRV